MAKLVSLVSNSLLFADHLQAHGNARHTQLVAMAFEEEESIPAHTRRDLSQSLVFFSSAALVYCVAACRALQSSP